MRQLAVVVVVFGCGGSAPAPAPMAAAPPPAPAPAPAPEVPIAAAEPATPAVAEDHTPDEPASMELRGTEVRGTADRRSGSTIGIGTIGRGGTGSGSGVGRGHGSMRARPPTTAGNDRDSGSFDRAAVKRVIQHHLPRLRVCYEQQLIREPTLTASVRVTFTIGTDGKVRKASTGSKSDFDGCLAAVFRKMTFPAPATVSTVVYPLAFTPAPADPGGARPKSR